MVEGEAALREAGAGRSRRPDGRVREDDAALPRPPPGTSWKAAAATYFTVAVCSAPGRGGQETPRIGPEGITLTERGRGTHTRHVNNIAMEAEDVADSLS